MQTTHLTIKKVESNRFPSLITLIAVLVFGMLLGSGAILAKNGKLHFATINPRLLLGGVIASTGETENVIASSSAASADSVVVKTEPQVTTPSIPSNEEAAVAVAQKKQQLSLLINDRTIAVDRLSQEIERTKNDSVAIITAFNQSCGNWKDDCSLPYTKSLETNNSSYNELVKTRDALIRELETSQQSLATLGE